MTGNKQGALADLLVLDLTRVVAGPYCGAILADMGARVIKIERPGKGDDARSYAPHVNGESAYYANLNRNKEGITLDFKSLEGKKIFQELVKKADILIENFRPGVMDRLGLGYDDLKTINPRLIYGAVSGYGSYGRYSSRPGYDILSQAMGGLMSVTGQKGDGPTRTGCAMGDILGGLNLSIGILAAVHARELTGQGQRVDVSLVDATVSSLENAFTRYFFQNQIPVRSGNAYASISPYNSFETKDGLVIIACGNQRLFEILARDILKKPEIIEDERFLTIPLRVQHNSEIDAIITEWTKQHTVDEVVEICLSHKVPSGPVYAVPDIVKDEHIAKDREMFVELDHPKIGKIKVNGTPIKMMGTPFKDWKPAPVLGADNNTILSEFLGFDEKQIDSLRKQGVL